MKIKKHLHFIIFSSCLIVLVLLLSRNPFSLRTLIPNIEPVPDAIYYVSFARNLASGKAVIVEREGRAFSPSIPPLYSLFLAPIFVINRDPRLFYFENVLLAIISLFLLYLVVKKLTDNVWIIAFSLFLFATNYYIYWLASLAMAENLIIPLFLFAIYLLLEKITKKKLFLAGLVATSFYATKYAAIPITCVFIISYLYKIISSTKGKKKWENVLIYFSGFIISFCLLSWYIWVTQNDLRVLNFVLSILFVISPAQHSKQDIFQSVNSGSTSPYFSFEYFNSNFKQYFLGILGSPIKSLWNVQPIMPELFASLGVLGLILQMARKKYRFISATLLFMLFCNLVFMSSFYAADMRYLVIAIPTVIVGFALFLAFLEKTLAKKFASSKVFSILLICLFISYVVFEGREITRQISLNLRHAETPWSYISVIQANNFFASIPNNKKKPILISALPPYFVDFYSNNTYELLPLSQDQEFSRRREVVWGDNDYSNLITLYKKYLTKQYKVYVDNYGLGGISYMNQSFDEIKANFNLVKVQSGCYDTCNIYKVELKK